MRYRLRERGLNFSIEKIREILKRDQYSIMEDQKTKKLYRVPSKLTKPIQDIYDTFGLKRKSKTIQIT